MCRPRSRSARPAQAAAGLRAGPSAGRAAGERPRRILPRQSERARRRAHGRDRHHRRSRLRLRALPAARLPRARRSRADLRRRPVAATHDGGAQGAGRRIARARSSSRSASTPPTNPASSSRSPRRGHSIGSHTWSHQNLSAKPVAGRQGRDRERHQRGGLGGRRADGAVLPLPGAAPSAGAGQLSRRAQHRDLLDRHGLVRLQDAQARAGRARR